MKYWFKATIKKIIISLQLGLHFWNYQTEPPSCVTGSVTWLHLWQCSFYLLQVYLVLYAVNSVFLFLSSDSSAFRLLSWVHSVPNYTQPASNSLTSSLQSVSMRSAGFSPLSFSASVLAPTDSRYLGEAWSSALLSRGFQI